jgi:prolyl-tRNA synthetase
MKGNRLAVMPEAPLPDKTKEFSRWYDEVLVKAELIDIRYGVKGFVVYRPNAMLIVRKIYDMFEEELMKKGHRQMLLPLVIPLSNLRKEAEHVKGFEKQVFIIERAGGEALEQKLVLRPTSETAIYPMMALWIRSYKDLPMKLFQSVAVYRHETKATRPLLRGREFLWIETHDAFASPEEARAQIREDLEIAKRVYDRLGLAFLVVEREPYDRFPGAESSFAYDALMPNGNVLQIATTHYLGQKFSKPFEVTFLDEKGEKRNPYTTCFGIGISRSLAAMILTHGDGYGLILPFGMAVYDIVIVPILYRGKEADVMDKARRVESLLKGKGYSVKLDDSENTPGDKFYRWEMLGVPVRLEIGSREVSEGTVTVFRRDLRKREKVKEEELIERLERLREELVVVLRERSWKTLKDRLVRVSTKEELLRMAEDGKIIITNFCGREGCADEIKAATKGYEVRGKRVDEEVEPWGNCVWCGKEAKRAVVLAKAF